MTAIEPIAVEDFPFQWGDPTDAGKTWEWDDMHFPSCLTPLGGDYARMIVEGDAYGSGKLDIAFEFRGQVFNGYVYYVSRHDVPEEQLPAARERAAALFRAQIPLAAAYWRKSLVELHELYAWMASVPVEDAPLADLAEDWIGAWERALRAWQIHFFAILGPYEALDVLADLYESVVSDAPPGEALRLTQGTITELTEVDEGLGRLADLLSSRPGSQEFSTELQVFLDQHGHLGQSWDDLRQPSWGEEPERLMAELAKRAEHRPEPARDRVARLSTEAEALADAFRVRAADDPKKLAEFERILALARDIGHLTETHNYWIDRMCQARLRSLAMRIGARLVDAGVIGSAGDVFFLHREEIAGLLRQPTDQRELIGRRCADLEHWSAVRPPKVLGRPPENEPKNRFGGDTVASDDAAVLRGTGASAGIARGPARVVLGPDDFGRVRHGDIIVAPSSNPSWVPLFTIAAGLVTNTGGVLSHAAVVAREFALPAVVGVADATALIREGQIVELDGTTGHVRLA